MVRFSCMSAAVMAALAANSKSIHAFIPSSGGVNKQHKNGHQQKSPFQQSSSGESPMVPYPPGNDADAKQDGINQEVWDSPYDDLFRSQLQQQQQGMPTKKDAGVPYQKKNVHIILFNQGLQGEGVHTIEYPKHSGSNVVLAFESYSDCRRFAKYLGSQMDPVPVPQTIVANNLTAYANALGMAVQVIPAGMNLKPPDRSEVDGSSGLVDQVPLLMKLKEQKAYLERLVGASPTPSSAGAGDLGPAWG